MRDEEEFELWRAFNRDRSCLHFARLQLIASLNKVSVSIKESGVGQFCNLCKLFNYFGKKCFLGKVDCINDMLVLWLNKQ